MLPSEDTFFIMGATNNYRYVSVDVGVNANISYAASATGNLISTVLDTGNTNSKRILCFYAQSWRSINARNHANHYYQASNDNVNWVTLDHREYEVHGESSFKFADASYRPYRYYRMNFNLGDWSAVSCFIAVVG